MTFILIKPGIRLFTERNLKLNEKIVSRKHDKTPFLNENGVLSFKLG